ncbi:hypothetical protein BKI52_29385 [marine bacterium AO1-C]|nr:hypothetical protein BKI52_29385 [marine bacterium AO1-C]
MIQLTWYQLILLLGFIQALILIFLLLFKSSKHPSNFLLATLLFILGRQDMSAFLPQLGLKDRYPFLLPFFYEYLFVLGPILYFYVRSLTKSTFRFDRRFWVYIGVGLSVDLAFHQVIYWWVATKGYSPWIATFINVVGLLTVIQIVVVLVLSIRTLRTFDRSLQDHFTNLGKINLRWLQNLLLAIVGLTIYWAVLEFIEVLLGYHIDGIFYHLLNGALIVLVYWIGFSQYLRPKVVIMEEEAVVTHQPSKTATSAFSEAKMAQYAQLLQQAMQQDKLYQDATLNLYTLAEHLNISTKAVSQTLNQYIGKNLSDFVNEYRVEDVKQKLLDPQFAHYTILGIAFEAGFNSKASFQRIFKKFVQCSPSEYKKHQGKHS